MATPSLTLPETLQGIDFDKAFQDRQRQVTGINVFGKTMTVVGYGLAIAAAVALVAAAILLCPPAILAIPVIASTATFISGFGITAAPLVFGALIAGLLALKASVLCALFGSTTKLKTDHVANESAYDELKNEIINRVSDLEKKTQGQLKTAQADIQSKSRILEAQKQDFQAVEKRAVQLEGELSKAKENLKKVEEELQQIKSKPGTSQDSARIEELTLELIKSKQEAEEKINKLQAYFQPHILKLEEQRDNHFKELQALKEQIDQSKAEKLKEQQQFEAALRAELASPKEAKDLAEFAQALKKDAKTLDDQADRVLKAAAAVGDESARAIGKEYKEAALAVQQLADKAEEKKQASGDNDQGQPGSLLF